MTAGKLNIITYMQKKTNANYYYKSQAHLRVLMKNQGFENSGGIFIVLRRV
jgi:hypothetical protein